MQYRILAGTTYSRAKSSIETAHQVWCLLDNVGGGSLLGTASQSLSEGGGAEREQIGGVDIVYLKNVLLKFLDAAATGRTDQVGPWLGPGRTACL